MRWFVLWVSALLFCPVRVSAQYPPLYPGPTTTPRMSEAERRLPIDQPRQVSGKGVRRPVDAARAKHDADELAKLAQNLPSEVDQVRKGLFPKDLIERLKSIEKLSKKLRREISP